MNQTLHKKPLPREVAVTHADPELGLTAAQARERRENGLDNGAPVSAGRSEMQIIAGNLLTFFNLVFGILAVVLALAGSSVKNMTFLIVVVCNLAIGCIQEIRAKRAVDKLTLVADQKLPVIRDGKVEILPSQELVRDDIVEFSAGQQICADACLLTGSLRVNEALVTGEEDAATKAPGDTLLSGSVVVAGAGRARLTAVGAASFASRLALEAKKDPKAAHSEMMRALDKLIRVVGVALIPVGIALFCQEFFLLGRGLTDSAEAVVAALVGMIPEGLYLLTSVAMAASSLKLTRDKVLVKDLNCIEALARVDVLCVDKTGTITEAAMEVENIVPLTDDPPERLERILTAIYSHRKPENDTARALIDMFAGETNWERDGEIPFTSQKKWNGISFRGQGAYYIGAPEFVMGDRYGELQETVEEWLARGCRVLLISRYAGELTEYPQSGMMRPLALIIMGNRLRPQAKETFRYFREQGVAVKVISGDNPVTASRVARLAEIPGAECYVDLSALETDEEIAQAAASCTVFGRVTPDKKKKLIAALKAAGHTVAMTGDGVNDVLAMKEANCSIAMAGGAQAAGQVAQMVLLNADFAAMPAIVGEGRRVINNIQRAASLFLVKNILSMGLALVTLITRQPYPFQPFHLTLISALTIGTPAFFLAMEPNYQRVSGKFLPTVLGRALPGGLANLLSVLLAQLVLTKLGMPTEEISTVCAAMVGCVGMLVLWDVCKPFDRFRRVLWSAMGMALVFCFWVMPGFFELQHGSFADTLVMLVLLLAAPTVLWLTHRGTERAEQLLVWLKKKRK